jgi:hypothetical protein
MKQTSKLVSLVIIAIVCLTLVTCGGSDPWITLWDGKTFNGWEGNLEWFRIQDGAIVGGTLEKRIPRNEFLCTETEYDNFELQAKFKVIGDNTNAGIQFRSKRIPDHHEVNGYQADLGQTFWGYLYDESRRRVTLAFADTSALAKVLDKKGWNTYRIRALGRRIQLWINDHMTVDYTEEDESIALKGIIGLQIHGGPPGEAWYKDIKIMVLEQEK